MDNPLVLVVEDDDELRELIGLYLSNYGYRVVLATDGEQALNLFSIETPDIVILDVLLPKMNGLDVCKKIRSCSSVPILFLSSKSESEDIVTGLDAGGDSYLTKPFDPSVLLAKVRATLRRQTYHKKDSDILRFGDLEIDLQSYGVRRNSLPITLSAKEMQLLLLLAKNPNQVFSVDQLYSQIWGPNEYGDTRTVMVHMSYLRKKLEIDPSHPQYIITVRGFGYKFQAD
ncbi:response regulator transcription factor [Ammoniphilus sp. CFH 90114]|uniref:response regulator transcription factor n=1 Tax=Ammoniphilus sp. CFH 90114 TaxID=2493665 RepID=UPI00100F4B15|nr:response regulator transcription factor [Ammoniphilus sp. CFH 90114]RXT01533.1 response regulator transcription factor [Ammoniphilus sp. CFH 90114]